MKKPGLASPINKENDLLAATRRAFGDQRREPRTLAQQMESLKDNELHIVLQTAQMVKMASSFHKDDQPYSAIVQKMYPNMKYEYTSLITKILEDAAPRGSGAEYKQKKMQERDDVIDKVLDGYAADMSKAGLK